jgi:PilZ domain
MEVLTAVHTEIDRESLIPIRAQGKDRRRARRDEISGALTVLWGSNSQEERITQANLIDVSARGAKFRINERIPSGSWLMFNHHPVGISGRGTVRYCRMVKCSYLIGVEFSGGTGWEAASNRFADQLRSLKAALEAN